MNGIPGADMEAIGASVEASHTQMIPASSADAKLPSAAELRPVYEASCEQEMSATIFIRSVILLSATKTTASASASASAAVTADTREE